MVSAPDERTVGDIISRVDLSVGGVGGLMKRCSTIEKAGSPTASAIMIIRARSFFGHIGAALRVSLKSTSGGCLSNGTPPSGIITHFLPNVKSIFPKSATDTN
jgi:hypothetical protein